MKNGFIKKADIVLFIVLLVLGIGSTVLLSKNAGNAARVEISIDGSVYKTVDLNEDQTIEIDNEFGKNVIEISDGHVVMKEADCKGSDCVKMGEISKGGQAIMCLPHRLIVTIVKGDGIDATAY
ncbi:MAG: NusG domain II-containing protein [Bacillota bacterium]|nr:NusG domain II-containing protein [Bacillota bacterium]